VATSLTAGGLWLWTALPGGDGWNGFAACAKTLSIARPPAAQVPAGIPGVQAGPWTLNSY
jgi:hypothetical protein